MTNPTAATLNRLGYRTDLAIDRLTAPLAEAIPAAVRAHAETNGDGLPVLTALGYALVMRSVDEAIRRVYGAYRGDRSAPMYQIISQAATAGHRRAVEATVGEIRERLKDEPELLALLEGKT